MLRNIYSVLLEGIGKIKWFFALVAERVKIEIAVIRLLEKSEKYEKDRQKILVSIGERVVELRSSKHTNIGEDTVVSDCIKKLEKLDKEISSLRKEANEISALEA